MTQEQFEQELAERETDYYCEEMTMSEMKIRYGFLTGNMFDGWTSEEIESIDIEASIRRYADQVEAEIRKSFPGTDVEVLWQNAAGILPWELSCQVVDPSDPDAERREDIAFVEHIAGEVYGAQDWPVLQ